MEQFLQALAKHWFISFLLGYSIFYLIIAVVAIVCETVGNIVLIIKNSTNEKSKE